MPFPFDLAGPEFLAFYLAATVAALGIATYAISSREHAAGGGALLTDPYEIAYLRAGAAEAVKVAVLSLIDRGLLRHSEDEHGAAMLSPPPGARVAPSHPLEREMVSRVSEPIYAEALTGAGLAGFATAALRPQLVARGLVSPGTGTHRLAFLGGAWGLLSVLFAMRMSQAIANQRSNIAFLGLLWVGAGVLAIVIGTRLPHAGAKRALDTVRGLLAGARQRIAAARPGAATAELALLAAAFGLWAVPEAAAPYAGDLSLALTPKPPRRSGDGSGGGCGSGSSDGGGGGGCGGCGGGGGCGGA